MHPLCQLTGRRAVHPLLLRLGDRVAELKALVEASTAEVREDVHSKKLLPFGHFPNGGGGVQPESKSFEVVFLNLICI